MRGGEDRRKRSGLGGTGAGTPPRSEHARRIDQHRIDAFRRMIYCHYRLRARRLPWRAVKDPYHILVSEVMLQQTQVSRVLQKYQPFMSRFPRVQDLAGAPLHDILAAWQGLGYNRRALHLKRAAEAIVSEHGGAVPHDEASLTALPGIGQATARAVQAFAFNKPVVFFETNIRTVYLHYFFKGKKNVPDADLEPLLEQTIDHENPSLWYNALMDFGSSLKKSRVNPGRASRHHVRQAPFEGSTRQVRGKILRTLLDEEGLSEEALTRKIAVPAQPARNALEQLESEGFVRRSGNRLFIARQAPPRKPDAAVSNTYTAKEDTVS